jgi:hypothetical protein
MTSTLELSVAQFQAERKECLQKLQNKYSAIAHAHPEAWSVHRRYFQYHTVKLHMLQFKKLIQLIDQKELVWVIKHFQQQEQFFLKETGHSGFIAPLKIEEFFRIQCVFENDVLDTLNTDQLRDLAQLFLSSVDLKSANHFLEPNLTMVELMWKHVGLPTLQSHPMFAELQKFTPQLYDIYTQTRLAGDAIFHLNSPFVSNDEGEYYVVSMDSDETALVISK